MDFKIKTPKGKSNIKTILNKTNNGFHIHFIWPLSDILYQFIWKWSVISKVLPYFPSMIDFKYGRLLEKGLIKIYGICQIGFFFINFNYNVAEHFYYFKQIYKKYHSKSATHKFFHFISYKWNAWKIRILGILALLYAKCLVLSSDGRIDTTILFNKEFGIPSLNLWNHNSCVDGCRYIKNLYL